MANAVDEHDAGQTTQPHQDDDSSEDSLAKRTGLKALLGGGAILAIATMAANGGNYVLNIALGRWLSPAEFADANLMVTLMLLVTAIAVALQLLAARYTSVAQSSSTDDIAEPLAAWLQRAALWAGVGTGAFIALLAPVWSNIFRSESPWPFVILAAGMPAYLAQAVGRGVLQGRLAFGQLAITFIVEMVVRVSTALGLVAAGFGVSGATAGLTLSFLATWLTVRRIQPIKAPPILDALQRIDLREYIVPIGVLLLGQIIINNGDVLITKSSFDRTDAGIYAAIALIGRAVFFLSWSAVTTLFPAVAQREAGGEQSTSLLTGALAAVAGACAVMVAAVAIGGEMFFSGVLGPEYSGVNPLVVKYALATSFFALANLIVTYHLSANRFVETRILLVGAVIQTALVWAMNSTMTSVIHAQLMAMFGLLVAVLASTYWPSSRVTNDNHDLKVASQ